jgi:hypothetical protein
LVPCLGSGNESEDWKKRLNGLHVEGEGGRLYVAETRVSGLESGEMDEVLWGLRWSKVGIGRAYMWEAGGRLQ